MARWHGSVSRCIRSSRFCRFSYSDCRSNPAGVSERSSKWCVHLYGSTLNWRGVIFQMKYATFLEDAAAASRSRMLFAQSRLHPRWFFGHGVSAFTGCGALARRLGSAMLCMNYTERSLSRSGHRIFKACSDALNSRSHFYAHLETRLDPIISLALLFLACARRAPSSHSAPSRSWR